MGIKRQLSMAIPTSRRSDDEMSLPLHASAGSLSPSRVPLHPPGETSSSDESSTDSFWSSPKDKDFSLPKWSSNPQSPGSDRIKSPLCVPGKDPSRGGSEKFRKSQLLFVVFVIVGVAAFFASQTSLDTASAQVSNLERHRSQMDGKLEKYERDIRILEREISAMDVMIQNQRDIGSVYEAQGRSHQKALAEMSELQQKLQIEAVQAETLKKQVQSISRQDILTKYGDGIHRVEIELVFPDNRKGPTSFVIELAPAAAMPHSVHTFLEMVSTGLLDGCSFILNALHVLKAAPLPYDGSSAAEKAKAFSDQGLESVAFKEYNEKYPHLKYTVGFAADGSPSFYINTDNNSEIHAGDPCFGKVIQGFDTVQRLEDNPTRNGIWFERRIGIKSARVLPSRNYVAAA